MEKIELTTEEAQYIVNVLGFSHVAINENSLSLHKKKEACKEVSIAKAMLAQKLPKKES